MKYNNKKRKKTHKKIYKKTKQQTRKVLKVVTLFFVVCILIYIIVLNVILYNLTIEFRKIETDNIVLKSKLTKYLFLGDSITERYKINDYFADYYVLNSGMGGDTTDDILTNLENRVYKYKPSIIFLMIGTNDVNQDIDTEYIFDNIKNIISNIQHTLPETKIFVEPILPAGNEWATNGRNEKRIKINKLLKQEYNNSSVTYIDMYDEFVDNKNGQLKNEYTEDGLHLNDKAYKLISEKIEKYM